MKAHRNGLVKGRSIYAKILLRTLANVNEVPPMSIDASSVCSIVSARCINSCNFSHISGGHRCLIGTADIVLRAEVMIPE